MRLLRVSAVALAPIEGEIERNLDAARRAVERAAGRGAAVVALPEMWPTSFCAKVDDSLVAASEGAVRELAATAADLGVVVVGSGYAARPGRRPANRAHVLCPTAPRGGAVEAPGYDKVHLFTPTAEHLSFSAGDTLPGAHAVTWPGEAAPRVRLAPIICYDLRFGEVVQHPVRGGAELLIVVAQWPDVRAAAWRALIMGRAAEAQAFVLGANRSGTATFGRRRAKLHFSGHTLLANPGGELLGEGTDDDGMLVRDIDLTEVRRMRRAVPVQRDARPELYAAHLRRPRRRERGDESE